MTGIPAVDEATLTALLAAWLPEQRWFAGKGRELSGVRIARRAVLLDHPEVLVEHLLVDVLAGGLPQRYQVPLATAHTLPDDRRAFPLTAEGADPVVYDGLRDPRGTESLVTHLAGRDEVGGLRFRLVAGAPDERFGQKVAAVVSFREGMSAEPEELSEFLRQSLANYKVPKVIVDVPEIRRSPAGKADYKWAKERIASN